MEKFKTILIVLICMAILIGATYGGAGRYQISAAEKMYCWVLNTETGTVTVMKLRDGGIKEIDSIDID